MEIADPESPVRLDDDDKLAVWSSRAELWASRLYRMFWQPAAVILGVIAVFWKIALTKQYTFLDSPDLAYMVVPRLQPTIYAIRHWSVFLWNPYEFFGQPSIGQVEPSVASPYTFLLALAPLHDGHIQFFYIHLWFVLLHCLAGLFAWRFFRELGCSAGPAIIGGVLFTTMGFFGNTDWPNHYEPGIEAPLVFLFLLRSLRGRAPLKNAAWAGVALGVSWLCGHHDPSVMMTYAVFAIGFAVAVRGGNWRQASLRMAVLFAAMGLVAAVQILPAYEYGKLSTRWTATGSKTWKVKVPFTEHERFSLKPPDLIHIVTPGGNGNFADPFTGIVALSLAAFGIWGGMRRKEVRLFILLGVAALLWAMAGTDALYGPLYAFAPLVEKTREPIVALYLFQFAIAALAAMGAETLFASPEPARERKIVRVLVWLGGGVLVLGFVFSSMKPAFAATSLVDGDSRPAMTALIALMLAAIYQAWSHKAVRREWALALIGLLLIVEQGMEVGWVWAQVHDPTRNTFINHVNEVQDLAEWLREQPNPKRVEKNDKDVPFNFGDWYSIDSANAYGASMLTQTDRLGGWWTERLGRMYGEKYWLGKTPDRGGLQEVFTGRTGIKIWYDPDAFPRAWTVHQIVVAPNEDNGYDMMNTGKFDLRTTALTVQSKPRLDTCDAQDKVTSIVERVSSSSVKVTMACKGLLVISDNYFPGWHAELDGDSVDIWKVNTAIRGVVVPAGKHTVTMSYRPFSVYFGFFCTLCGVAGAIVLQRRREDDGLDLL